MASPVKVLKRVRIVSLFLSCLGIGLCGYSVYVSSRKQADDSYRAFCDIDENISCSKVFTSKWGKGFGFLGGLLGEDSPFVVSNGIYGLVFYGLVIILGNIKSEIAAHIQRVLVLATNLMSIYLAYILFFVLKDKCVVCIATYVINLLLTICCFIRVRYTSTSKSKKKSGKNTADADTKKGNNKNANKNSDKSNKNSNKQNGVKQVTKAKNANAKPTANAKQTAKQNNAKQDAKQIAKQNAKQNNVKQNAKQNNVKQNNKQNAKQNNVKQTANAKQNAKQNAKNASAKQNSVSNKQSNKNSAKANKNSKKNN